MTDSEYRTDHNFNVRLCQGQWVLIRPNPAAPHASTSHAALAAADRWQKLNAARWGGND